MNTFYEGEQGLGGVARDGDRALVVWSSGGHHSWPLGVGYGGVDGPDGDSSSIAAAFVDEAGPGEEFLVNTHATSGQWQPAVARGDSAFVVAWSSAAPEGDPSWDYPGDNYRIRARVLPDNAATSFDDVLVAGKAERTWSEADVDETMGPSVIHLGGDRFLITWEESGEGIWGRVLNAAGSVLEEPKILVPGVYTDSVAVGEGEVGFWIIYTTTGPENEVILKGRRFNSDTLSPEATAKVDTPATLVWSLLFIYGGAAASMDASGGVTVVWTSLPNFAEGIAYGKAYIRRFDAEGVPTANPLKVDPDSKRREITPGLVELPSGDFASCWVSWETADPVPRSIRCRRFDAFGVPIGDAYELLPEEQWKAAPGDRIHLDVDSEGEVTVYWSGRGIDSAYEDIFGRKIPPF